MSIKYHSKKYFTAGRSVNFSSPSSLVYFSQVYFCLWISCFSHVNYTLFDRPFSWVYLSHGRSNVVRHTSIQ